MKNSELCYTILSFILLGTWVSTVEGDRLSACFNSTQKSIDITCSPGSMVRILKAFYGFSPAKECQFREGDCILPEYENYPCVGRESCSINLPTGTYGSLIQSCGRYSNYFQVEYECVPAALTHDICRVKKLVGQSGYLSTPRYPNNYHNKTLKCNTTIEVSAGQKLILHIIDLDLESKGKTDCADWMYFNDNFRSITLCGRRANDTYKAYGNYMEVELETTSQSRSKGFWLYYEAVPHLPTATPNLVTKLSTPTNPNKDRETTEESGKTPTLQPPNGKETSKSSTPIPVHYVTQPSRTNLPFAAIAGGVIGTLTLILLVLLLLLLIKWIKERRYYHEKEQFLDHRNPAFRSSGDFNACTVDIDYYHC